MIEAGRLRHRLAIEQRTRTRNAIGQPVDTWAALATVNAERLESKQGEHEEKTPNAPYRGPGEALVATARFRVRWRSDLLIGQRVTTGGHTYTLTAIEEPDWHESLILTVTA